MPKGYHRATDVMPAELARRAFAHLGATVKITFAASGRRPNSSEKLLPEEMAAEIRKALDKRKALKCRTIYFGPELVAFRRSNAEKAATFLATEKEMPLSAIADAVGVATWTLRRWGITQVAETWSPNHLEYSKQKKYHELGLAHCKARGLEIKSLYGNHYMIVGACLKRLEKWQAEQDLLAKEASEKEAGGFAKEDVAKKAAQKEKPDAKFW